MQRWDYLTVIVASDGKGFPVPQVVNGAELVDWKRIEISEYLARLGREGWELVGVLPQSLAYSGGLIFKRPLASSPPVASL